MDPNSVYDLKSFYNTREGRVVRRVLSNRVRDLWPDLHGLRLMGCGYATPYMRMFEGEAERVFCTMPAALGAHQWPGDGKNKVCLSHEEELPIETASVDRVLMVHDLEFSEVFPACLQEVWRVLKSNGRLLVMVPNRTGLWSHADWSPFGHGRPFTSSQIHRSLRENSFVHEQTEEALFMPPIRSAMVLKSAGFFERYGRYVLPFVAGVHLVEASKQLYARIQPGPGTKVPVGGRRAVAPKPVGASRTFY